MTAETPTISVSNYRNDSYDGRKMLLGGAAFISNASRAQDIEIPAQMHFHIKPQPTQQEIVPMSARRIVQVYIADPSDAVPLADAILYTGEQKMTDLTDQELFFEIDIKSILEAHNAKRTKVIDKKIKDRTEYLEPAKVRDLKMVVVTVASF